MFSIGAYVLTEEEVAKRKRYLEITPEDERRLKEAHPHLRKHTQAIIDRFYEYLLAHEHTRAMLAGPGVVERLKGLQARYFEELTAGEYGLAYFENRLRVGQAHHRIGLSPEWYLGAYVKYLHIASDVLISAFGRDYERFYQTLVSLTKVIYLDMGLAVDAYHFSAQQVLQKSNEDLKEAQGAKQQLVDMIVHDLQNPLTGIMTALQVLESRDRSFSKDERGAMEEALRRCKDLSHMIMNVLQVSRAEAGKLDTYMEDLDLPSFVRSTVEAFRMTAESEGRNLEVEAPPALAVRSDQSLLKRILQNLLRNALRHTPRGSRIRVRVSRDISNRPQVSVIDEGPGIPLDVQPLLFEPFGAAKLRDAGRRVDTGLGLASSRLAAQAMGAEIAVQSDGKHGTSFSVTLS